jgi:hypothetical protein
MKKTSLNFNINQVIEANLAMPSIQRTLKNEFKIFNFNFSTITSEKFINNYKTWPIQKKEEFYRTLGGNVFSKKVQYLLENINKNEVTK